MTVRGRKSPKICHRTRPAPRESGHDNHVCLENERHPGQHICGIPTAAKDMCGYRW